MLASPPDPRSDMDVPIESRKRFHTTAPLATVFDVLSDVPRSVSHYPDVESLEDLGGGAYRWAMREGGAAGIRHQVSYACHYVCDRASGEISWTPVEGVGNGTQDAVGAVGGAAPGVFWWCWELARAKFKYSKKVFFFLTVYSI